MQAVATPCVIWHMYIAPNGYGRAGRNKQAHRMIYEQTKGAIPEGMTIDHLCRNRACVNPDHLEAVPSGVNVLRGIGVTARNAVKSHCLRGHLFDEHNTIRLRNGGRACRKCNAIRTANYRRRINNER